jgi:hypothetical protein
MLLGLFLGAGITAAVFVTAVIPKFNTALDEDQKVIEGQKQAIATYQQAGKNLIHQMSASMTRETQEVVTNTQKVTLLYDPSTFQGLAAFGGPVQVFPSNKAVPYQGLPRWIIPGKVRPMVAGSSTGVTYSYFDLKTETYDGPFLPDVPQQRP